MQQLDVEDYDQNCCACCLCCEPLIVAILRIYEFWQPPYRTSIKDDEIAKTKYCIQHVDKIKYFLFIIAFSYIAYGWSVDYYNPQITLSSVYSENISWPTIGIFCINCNFWFFQCDVLGNFGKSTLNNVTCPFEQNFDATAGNKTFYVVNSNFTFTSDDRTYLQVGGVILAPNPSMYNPPVLLVGLFDKKSETLSSSATRPSNSLNLQLGVWSRIVWSKSNYFALDTNHWDKNLFILSYQQPSVQFSFHSEVVANIQIPNNLGLNSFILTLLPENGLVEIEKQTAPTLLNLLAQVGGLWTVSSIIVLIVIEILNRLCIRKPDSRISHEDREAILYLIAQTKDLQSKLEKL